ncbi:MAG: bifunctional riboflavin kinase/FAD synthetase [Clostridiales bacterium]|nr:bifunctional riboflavin kinase/FAD synthetase [Clostridiales bacterium]
MTMKTPAAVALGMFDGVHLGHRALMERLGKEAERLDAVPAVYTFSNHPLEVLGGSVRMLSDVRERNQLLRSLGAEEVESVPFTRETAGMSTERFVDVLLEKWDVRALVVGYNYTCGDRGAGTPETLMQIGARRGFSVSVVEPVLCEGEPVSSSRIREAVERGNVSLAEKLLGRNYSLSGKVVRNRRIGSRIGFPTANIDADPKRVIPADGVYAAYAFVGGSAYRAVTNVGTNPTVHGDKLTIETHIIDFDADIYGETLSVAFRKRLRGELMFDTLDALIAQIRVDVEEAAALRG